MGGSGLDRTAKNLLVRTRSDSIFSDWDWARTDKFHSLFISAMHLNSKKQHTTRMLPNMLHFFEFSRAGRFNTKLTFFIRTGTDFQNR